MEPEGREKDRGESPEIPPSTLPLRPPLPLPPLLHPPPRITFRPLDARSLPDLRALNYALFPINYGPRVYEQALAAGGISHGAFYDQEELVGAITVRLEAGTTSGSATAAPAASLFVAEGEEGKVDDESSGESESSLDGGLARMYVMTVGVLSPWRGKGIGEKKVFGVWGGDREEGEVGEGREEARFEVSEGFFSSLTLLFSRLSPPKKHHPPPPPQEQPSSPTPSRWPPRKAGSASRTFTRTSPTRRRWRFTRRN